jgi:hypothetical protein
MKMSEEGKSRVEGLKESLYSRTKYHDPDNERRPVAMGEISDVEENWDSPDLDEMLKMERRKPETTFFMKKVFIIAVIFFLTALSLAVYAFFGGANFISSKNVDIKVLGPVAVSAGEILELSIVVSNKNNADLQMTNLSVQYPQGTRDPEDPALSMTYLRESLDSIRAGREATYNARAVIFGERGEVKEIKITVEYKIKGSNATFYKEKTYEIAIGDSPVTMSVSQPPSITSGENFTTTITLTHNNTELLRNVVLRAEYPYGYSVASSDPEAASDNNFWVIGDMAPGSKKVLTINGRLVGENEEERSFRFYAGVADEGNFASFGTTLYSAIETVAISRPSIGLNIQFNGDRGSTYIAPAGKSINTTIRFQNNLPDKLINPRLEVKILGTALDKLSVTPQVDGFYDSTNNRIVWDLRDLLAEGELTSGASGQVSFNFNSLLNLPPNSSNLDIALEVTLSGTSVGDTQRTIGVVERRTVKISSQVSLASKALYSTGGYANTGPIPPKAEQKTTYTLMFNVGNTQNEIGAARVTAVLGPNVEWLNNATEGISYNESNRTVTWNIGKLDSGIGFSSSSLQGAFQVAITPSIGQIGTSPTLASNVSFTGTDTFTGETVTVTNPSLTTNISSDPKFVQGDERVVR